MSNFKDSIYRLDLRPAANWVTTFETLYGRRELLVRSEKLIKKTLQGELFAAGGIGKCFRTVSPGDFVFRQIRKHNE